MTDQEQGLVVQLGTVALSPITCFAQAKPQLPLLPVEHLVHAAGPGSTPGTFLRPRRGQHAAQTVVAFVARVLEQLAA